MFFSFTHVEVGAEARPGPGTGSDSAEGKKQTARENRTAN